MPRPGGGRKRVADLDPGLGLTLQALVEPDERGDPMSPSRWTMKSTRTLARETGPNRHKVTAEAVADLLREESLSLQANARTIEGSQHPDWDAQFRHLNEQARDHRGTDQPGTGSSTSSMLVVAARMSASGSDCRPTNSVATLSTTPESCRSSPSPGWYAVSPLVSEA